MAIETGIDAAEFLHCNGSRAVAPMMARLKELGFENIADKDTRFFLDGLVKR